MVTVTIQLDEQTLDMPAPLLGHLIARAVTRCLKNRPAGRDKLTVSLAQDSPAQQLQRSSISALPYTDAAGELQIVVDPFDNP